MILTMVVSKAHNSNTIPIVNVSISLHEQLLCSSLFSFPPTNSVVWINFHTLCHHWSLLLTCCVSTILYLYLSFWLYYVTHIINKKPRPGTRQFFLPTLLALLQVVCKLKLGVWLTLTKCLLVIHEIEMTKTTYKAAVKTRNINQSWCGWHRAITP